MTTTFRFKASLIAAALLSVSAAQAANLTKAEYKADKTRNTGVANGQYLPEWPTPCKRRTNKAPMAGMGKCSALSAKGNTWRQAA